MKYWMLVLALVLVASPFFAANEHDNLAEKKAGSDMSVVQPMKVDGQQVDPGVYRIACDRTEVSFTRVKDGKVVAKTPCRGKELAAKAKQTEVYTQELNGERVLTRLLLKGSTVEHIF